jgi:hypothetical protein
VPAVENPIVVVLIGDDKPEDLGLVVITAGLGTDGDPPIKKVEDPVPVREGIYNATRDLVLLRYSRIRGEREVGVEVKDVD